MVELLVIDDDGPGARLVKAIFAPEGIGVSIASTGETGIATADEQRPDVVVLDYQLPDGDGLGVLERLKARMPEVPVIMLTATHEVKIAVRATQLGAFDYITKPLDADELVLAVQRALETRALKAEVAHLRRQVRDGGSLTARMGDSPQVRELVAQVETVASSRFSVLITGETGTGKELVAQAIHRHSERSADFHAIDCGAIPEALLESELFGHEKGSFTGADRRKRGRFELAAGGTLFLDEIGNLPLSLQAKLLRVLESREVHAVGAARSTALDLRFVAATNEQLDALVNSARFRADLYFRLAQYTIRVPPLRERAGDIPFLAARFLQEVSVELRRPARELAPEAIEILVRYPWPGNVRELRNVVRNSVLESDSQVIRADVVRRLTGESKRATPRLASTADGRSLREIADTAAREAERRAISEVLRATRGNKASAARKLQTDYKTLHLKIKQLGLRAKDFED